MGCTSSIQKPVFDDIKNLPNKPSESNNSNFDFDFDFRLIKKFNLEGVIGNFYVKSVYDGDTITVLIPMKISIYSNISFDFIDPNNLNDKTICNYEIKLRLFGIDTPELKPLKNIPNREEHIKKAHEAKEFLENLILNKVVQIKFLSNDKYGRSLGIIYIKNIIINKLMVEEGFAKEYDGGTKDSNF
jgi:endonuclease YncB( thermonuclease family)